MTGLEESSGVSLDGRGRPIALVCLAFPGMAMRQFGGIQHIPQLNDLFVVTCEYGLVDIDVAVIGRASEFYEVRKLSIDFPLCSRDDLEWFSTEF